SVYRRVPCTLLGWLLGHCRPCESGSGKSQCQCKDKRIRVAHGPFPQWRVPATGPFPEFFLRAPERRIWVYPIKGVGFFLILFREAHTRPNAIVGRCDFRESTKPRAKTPSPAVVIGYDKAA